MDVHPLQTDMTYPSLRQVVTDLYVLQPQISHILQISRIGIFVAFVENLIAGSIARKISARIIFGPIVALHPFRHLIVFAVILSPERALTGRVPVLFAYSLKERAQINAIPISIEPEAIDISGLRVSYHFTVTRIIYRILSTRDVAISIEILHTNIARIHLPVAGVLHERIVTALPGRISFSHILIYLRLALVQAINHESPYLTKALPFIITAAIACRERHRCVIVLVDDRIVISKSCTNRIIKWATGHVEPILPLQRKFPTPC